MTTAYLQDTISGAELKVRLGALGLPPSWLAEHLDVTMRTVVRWFDSDVVSSTVATELETLCAKADSEITRMLKAATRKKAADPIVLTTYRTDEEFADGHPASWHRQIVFRVMEQLRAQGHEVTIRYA